MNEDAEEKPEKISAAPTQVAGAAGKASDGQQSANQNPADGNQPKIVEVSDVEAKLRKMSAKGRIILITGHAAAGKTFSVVQAQNQAVKANYVRGDLIKLIDGSSLSDTISTTKDVQAVEFRPTGDNQLDCLYFIDVPGEWFEFGGGAARFCNTDDVNIKQLAACACAADGLILVLPGPAVLNVRDVAAPGERDGPLAMTDAQWKEQNQDVTRSLDLLPHLSHLMQALAKLQRHKNLDRIGAFQAFCSLSLEERMALPKGKGKSDIPLFVMVTKADQVFGLDPTNTKFKPQGFAAEIDGTNPWHAIAEANRDRGNRSPIQSFVGNFEAVNIDYSSACPGGAIEESVGGIATFEIPEELKGNGWNVWEPVRWLLERIAERKSAGLDTRRLGWFSWERWRQIPKIMLMKDRVVAQHGGPASVLRIAAATRDLGNQ